MAPGGSRYVAGRIAQAVLVLVVAVTLAFFLFRGLPGGSTGGSPFHVTYYEYVRNIVLYQDFGHSLYMRQPVFAYLLGKAPWTVFLIVYGLGLGRTASVLLGAAAAYRQGTRLDGALTVLVTINRGVPYYFVAVAVLLVFGFVVDWFPVRGRMNPETAPGLNYPFVAGVLHHAALPILSMFVGGFRGALSLRGNAVREMGKPYIRLGHLRGLGAGRIAVRYVGRNSVLPVYTGLVVGIGQVFSTSIIVDIIFQYSALGYATFAALKARDYPLLMGAFIFFTTLTVAGVLVVDLTYGLVDPRVKTGGERESF